MKRAQAAVVSVLLFAVQGAAYAQGVESTFPADAEASYSLPALDTYADMQIRNGSGPDEVWGVGKRQGPAPHDAFPFGGGPIDD